MKTVLLIDDEPELLQLLEEHFIQMNFHAITYPYAVSVPVVRLLMPDLIVLDHNLGEITGAELCKQLKADTETQNIPVLIVSADDHLAEFAKDSCADAYLEKPFDLETLRHAVKNITLSEAT